MAMKKIVMFFLIMILAFANIDEWIVAEEPLSIYTQDKNTMKKRFLERLVEKESAVMMVRGKVQTSTPAVRKNGVKLLFCFLIMCFLYFQSKKGSRGETFLEIQDFLEYHIRRMRQIHQMDGKKKGICCIGNKSIG